MDLVSGDFYKTINVIKTENILTIVTLKSLNHVFQIFQIVLQSAFLQINPFLFQVTGMTTKILVNTVVEHLRSKRQLTERGTFTVHCMEKKIIQTT